ncbi:protein of unknown function [Hyphomicrobium sp. 1Nfss2.1]
MVRAAFTYSPCRPLRRCAPRTCSSSSTWAKTRLSWPICARRFAHATAPERPYRFAVLPSPPRDASLSYKSGVDAAFPEGHTSVVVFLDKGWIMDVYLVRVPPAAASQDGSVGA